MIRSSAPIPATNATYTISSATSAVKCALTAFSLSHSFVVQFQCMLEIWTIPESVGMFVWLCQPHPQPGPMFVHASLSWYNSWFRSYKRNGIIFFQSYCRSLFCFCWYHLTDKIENCACYLWPFKLTFLAHFFLTQYIPASNSCERKSRHIRVSLLLRSANLMISIICKVRRVPQVHWIQQVWFVQQFCRNHRH